jgi:hydroxyacylglutathione hydrolase
MILKEVVDHVLVAEPAPLTLGDVLRAQRRGAQLLDTRSLEDFANGHLVGSTHIALGGNFARWAVTLLSRQCPVALICAPGDEREAAERLRRAGFGRLLGYLVGGIEATRDILVLVRHPIRISSTRLRQRLTRDPVTLVDVRAEMEWRQTAIPGALNIPLEHLRGRIGELPEGPIVVYCRTGEQSSTAASLIEQTGRMNVVILMGGIVAWQESGAMMAVSDA